MHNRTSEQLKEWLSREKEKRLHQQELERKRQQQIKAQERFKKLQHKKHMAKLEKQAQEALKHQNQPLSRTLAIYSTKYIERFATENDELYQSREELKEAEARGEGKIKWKKWQELVYLTKQQLQTKK